MSTYTVTAPDGHDYVVEGPEGASDEAIVAAVTASLPPGYFAPYLKGATNTPEPTTQVPTQSSTTAAPGTPMPEKTSRQMIKDTGTMAKEAKRNSATVPSINTQNTGLSSHEITTSTHQTKSPPQLNPEKALFDAPIAVGLFGVIIFFILIRESHKSPSAYENTSQGSSSEDHKSEEKNKSEHSYEERLNALRNNESKCFAILGLIENSSASEIKAAFKKKMSDYHPDKVSGLGDKLKQVAEEETKLLNIAYQTLKKLGHC